MPKTFEKDFITYCNNQELEVNPNQIAVIKKLEQYYQSNFKSFFSKLFSKQNSKRGFYLFGGVGVGKTMILNFFFDQVDQKKLRIKKLWETLPAENHLTFNKILTGTFRVGVSVGLITKSIAKLINIDEEIISHRLMGDFKPSINAYEFLFNRNITVSYTHLRAHET